MVGPEPQRVEGIVLHKEDPGSCPSHAGASPMTMRPASAEGEDAGLGEEVQGEGKGQM